ncbi:MAG: hypothetical protein ABSG80_09740 [Verrucomicrobiota bacterium]
MNMIKHSKFAILVAAALFGSLQLQERRDTTTAKRQGAPQHFLSGERPSAGKAGLHKSGYEWTSFS